MAVDDAGDDESTAATGAERAKRSPSEQARRMTICSSGGCDFLWWPPAEHRTHAATHQKAMKSRPTTGSSISCFLMSYIRPLIGLALMRALPEIGNHSLLCRRCDSRRG